MKCLQFFYLYVVDVSQIEEGKIGSSILVKPLVGNSMKFLIVWLQWLKII